MIMKYIYDGSFEGLLTAVFEAYSIIENVNFSIETEQVNFFEDIHVSTDLKKYERVKNSIIKNISKSFFNDLVIVYHSDNLQKADVIAKCIKGVYKYGLSYLNSAQEEAVMYRSILKNFVSENHDYKGLLRFREIQDGFLFAEFTPHNDILKFITPHFLKRMPNEKFVIYDVNRKTAAFCVHGNCEFMEVEYIEAVDSDREIFFKSAWKKFYSAVGIDERKNKKLMMSNMPKKYWKYLPEKDIEKSD